MVFFPNCKINIGLDIISRRDDGFHNLNTLMYPVDGFCDSLEIVRSDDPLMQFTQSGMAVDCLPERNLCTRAYSLMQQLYDIPPIRMHLHKVIPFGAGLGGGSADAALTIRGVNALFCLGLEPQQMESLAAQLGSDTAFFIRNRPALASSRGEILEPSPISLKGLYIIIMKPEVGVSTAQAYSGVTPKQPEAPLAQRLSADISQWRSTIGNDFEREIFALYPQIGTLKQALYSCGALYASMSGSGSGVYGIFDKKPEHDYLPSHNIIYQGVISR